MNAPAAKSAYHATDGAAYEVFLGRWTRRLAEPLLDFADFQATGRLLDVGCGTGSMAHAMAAQWPARHVIGIDIAPPYVAFAQSQARLANLHFEVGDAAKLPYADASFGGAAAQLVLNFVPDPIAALNEMKRVVATDGRLVAAVWDFRGGLVYQRIFWDTARRESNRGRRQRGISCSLACSRSQMVCFGCSNLSVLSRSSGHQSLFG